MSEELRAAIERTRGHKMPPQERFLQKVSFVYGQQDWDSKHQMTKRQCAEFIAEHDGYPPEWVELVPAIAMEAREGRDAKQGSVEGDSAAIAQNKDRDHD